VLLSWISPIAVPCIYLRNRMETHILLMTSYQLKSDSLTANYLMRNASFARLQGNIKNRLSYIDLRFRCVIVHINACCQFTSQSILVASTPITLTHKRKSVNTRSRKRPIEERKLLGVLRMIFDFQRCPAATTTDTN